MKRPTVLQLVKWKENNVLQELRELNKHIYILTFQLSYGCFIAIKVQFKEYRNIDRII